MNTSYSMLTLVLLCVAWASPEAERSCGWNGRAVVVGDMSDGDEKLVSLSGSRLTLKPHANNQTWVVHSTFKISTCSAVIDFNVPGKPGVPPVNLTATLWTLQKGGKSKISLEFTDPSGYLAPKEYPVNEWVQIE